LRKSMMMKIRRCLSGMISGEDYELGTGG